MTKLIALNSNEINQIPERYTTGLDDLNINISKSLEILKGLHPERSKEELLNEIFSKMESAMPIKNGKIEINDDIIDFIETITGKRKEKPENELTPAPAPTFKKKKDLKKKVTYGNV